MKRLIALLLMFGPPLMAIATMVLGKNDLPMGRGCHESWDWGNVDDVYQDSSSPTGWFAQVSVIRHTRAAGPPDADICYPALRGGYVFIKEDVAITQEEAERHLRSNAPDVQAPSYLPPGWEDAVFGKPYEQKPWMQTQIDRLPDWTGFFLALWGICAAIGVLLWKWPKAGGMTQQEAT